MVLGDLAPDPTPNLEAQASRTLGAVREFEFVSPLMGSSDGNAAWERGHAYQIAFLVGPGERYGGITDEVWMSGQIVVRIGGRSTTSIYLP
jgi:hypothetical protein